MDSAIPSGVPTRHQCKTHGRRVLLGPMHRRIWVARCCECQDNGQQLGVRTRSGGWRCTRCECVIAILFTSAFADRHCFHTSNCSTSRLHQISWLICSRMMEWTLIWYSFLKNALCSKDFEGMLKRVPIIFCCCSWPFCSAIKQPCTQSSLTESCITGLFLARPNVPHWSRYVKILSLITSGAFSSNSAYLGYGACHLYRWMCSSSPCCLGPKVSARSGLCHEMFWCLCRAYVLICVVSGCGNMFCSFLFNTGNYQDVDTKASHDEVKLLLITPRHLTNLFGLRK